MVFSLPQVPMALQIVEIPKIIIIYSGRLLELLFYSKLQPVSIRSSLGRLSVQHRQVLNTMWKKHEIN